MRKAMAALKLSFFAFVVGILPASAQQAFDPIEEYFIPTEGVYEAMISMAVTGSVFLMLLVVILVLLAMGRKRSFAQVARSSIAAPDSRCCFLLLPALIRSGGISSVCKQLEIEMTIGKDEFANFLRIDAELRALAGRYFDARARTFYAPRLRVDLESVVFHGEGCTIYFSKSRCSNCRGNADDLDDIYVSLDDLLEFSAQHEPDAAG